MMVIDPARASIDHGSIRDFPSLVERGDVVVVNDTRVFPARLTAAPIGNMQRGVEVMLTRRRAPLEWEALLKPARRVRPGAVLTFSEALQCEVIDREGAAGTLRFRIDGGEEGFWQEVDRIGSTPLPPYIERAEPSEEDRAAYQTVWARHPGAVAAPTAGLHFDDAILAAIVERGATIVPVTLHVGGGTFKPVKADRIEDHVMDAEWFEVTDAAASAINGARTNGGRVIAIGTTAVRTLESAATDEGAIRAGSRETAIFITPGYRFRAVDALLTNFHLPESTLIMLVSAFAGRSLTFRAYDEAVRERYRFYSYGDCMFIRGRAARE